MTSLRVHGHAAWARQGGGEEAPRLGYPCTNSGLHAWRAADGHFVGIYSSDASGQGPCPDAKTDATRLTRTRGWLGWGLDGKSQAKPTRPSFVHSVGCCEELADAEHICRRSSAQAARAPTTRPPECIQIRGAIPGLRRTLSRRAPSPPPRPPPSPSASPPTRPLPSPCTLIRGKCATAAALAAAAYRRAPLFGVHFCNEHRLVGRISGAAQGSAGGRGPGGGAAGNRRGSRRSSCRRGRYGHRPGRPRAGDPGDRGDGVGNQVGEQKCLPAFAHAGCPGATPAQTTSPFPQGIHAKSSAST
eukprot:365584-Chlamydomonas_euryale.AAC.17